MPKVNGFDAIMTRHITADRVFCIIGRNGTQFLQPGRSLDIGSNANGTCMRNTNYVPFKVKKVSGNVMFNCNENWSVYRVRGSHWEAQDSDVSDYGLESYIKSNFPNDYNDEFWLFPKNGTLTSMEVVGNGGHPVTSMESNTGYIDSKVTRGVTVRGCDGWSATVCIHSNDLQHPDAIAINVIGVYIPFIEADGALGPAGLRPLSFKNRITAVGSSSQKYGDLMVWAANQDTNDGKQWLGAPVLRLKDGVSMIRNSYSDSSELRVETVFQAKGT